MSGEEQNDPMIDDAVDDGAEPMKWYFIQAHSGHEPRAAENLKEQARQAGLSADLGRVVVPMETVVEVKNGEKTERKRKFYPGYILVQMRFSTEMWHAVRKTPRVSGFVGNATEPTPIREREVQKILGLMEEGSKAPTPVLSFHAGDHVRVIDGPFKNFSGTVEEVNPDKAKVRVLVSIFGRATPVELDFVQVEPAAG